MTAPERVPASGVRDAARTRTAGPSTSARSGGVLSRSAGASHVATDRQSLLALQRTAGNTVVQRLLDEQASPAPTNVIHRMTMTSSDLDATMGKSDKGVLGIGKSTYAVIRSQFAKYEQAKAGGASEQELADMLADLDTQVTKWLNEHREKLGDQDTERRGVMQQLNDELTGERVKLSKGQAHEEYMKGIVAGNRKAGGFKALTGSRPSGAATDWEAELGYEQRGRKFGPTPDVKSDNELRVEKRRAVAKEKGVTRAEQASFGVYTQGTGDFEYINPVAAGHTGARDQDTDRLAAGKAKMIADAPRKAGVSFESKAGWGLMSDQTLREEGSLHMAMIVSGLKKLDPHKGETFRGEALTEATFKERAKVGKKFNFPNVTSSSKRPVVAASFAGKNCSTQNDIQVYWVFTNAGKDVEMFSMEDNEGEVLIEPAEAFVVDRIVDFDALDHVPSEGAALYNHLKTVKRPQTARKVYVVHVMAAPTMAAPPKPPVPPLPALPKQKKLRATAAGTHRAKGAGRATT